MPSPQLVVAMVNEGWSFETLMAMTPGEFAYWLGQQDERNRKLAKAAKPR